MTMTVDVRVADLAADILDEYKGRNQKDVDSLSRSIQQTIEDWIEDFEGARAENPFDTLEEKEGTPVNSLEHDLATYMSELQDFDPDETVECRCGQEVRIADLVEVTEWDGHKFVTDAVCAECAKEEDDEHPAQS